MLKHTPLEMNLRSGAFTATALGSRGERPQPQDPPLTGNLYNPSVFSMLKKITDFNLKTTPISMKKLIFRVPK